jgi:hypothetical protein
MTIQISKVFQKRKRINASDRFQKSVHVEKLPTDSWKLLSLLELYSGPALWMTTGLVYRRSSRGTFGWSNQTE